MSIPLHYTAQGAGPYLVLLHGYMSSHEYWQDVAVAVEGSWTVLSIDLLGFGSSPKPSDALYTLDEHVAAVADMITELTGNEPVRLAGHSMGALIAAAYAGDRPEKISRLVLCNPPVFTSVQQAQDSLQDKMIYKLFFYSAAGRFLWPVARFVLASYTALLSRRAHLFARTFLKNTYHSRKSSLANVIESTNILELVQKLQMPTRLIMGETDRPVYRRNLLKTSLPENVQITWVATGHHSPIHAPQEVVAALVN